MFIRPGINDPHQDIHNQPQLRVASPSLSWQQPATAEPLPDVVMVSAVSKATPVLEFIAPAVSQPPRALAVFINQLATVPLARLTEHEQQLVLFLRQLVEQAAHGHEQALLLLATGEKILQLALSNPRAAKAVYDLLEQMAKQQVPYDELAPLSRELLNRIDIHCVTDLERLGGVLPLWQTAQAMAGAQIVPESFSEAYHQWVLPLLKASCIHQLWSAMAKSVALQSVKQQTPSDSKQGVSLAQCSPPTEPFKNKETAMKQDIEQRLVTVWQQRKQQIETEQRQRQWLDQNLQQQRQTYEHTAQWLKKLIQNRHEKQQQEIS